MRLEGSEKKVLVYLWNTGKKSLSRQEIVDSCSGKSYRSTYMTLRRLEDKGFIRCLQGRRWINNASYEVLKTKEEFIVEIIKEFNPDMLQVIELLGKRK